MIKRESKMHINRNKINQDGIEIYINQGNDLYAGCKHKVKCKNK